MTDVERVLKGLREAEVPAGMEERVLRAVRARAAVRVLERGWWLGWRVYGVGAVAMVAVVVGVVGVAGHWVGGRAAVTVVRGKAPAVVMDRPAEGAPPNLATVTLSRGGGVRGLRVRGKRAVRRRGEEGEAAGALAASFPAPPLPLTEQERLLLRVVHGRDPVQVAMLDGVTSLNKFAEERVEFQRFFAVPVKKAAPETKAESTSTGEEK